MYNGIETGRGWLPQHGGRAVLAAVLRRIALNDAKSQLLEIR